MPGVDFNTNIILNTNTLSSITSMDFDRSANNYMQLCNTNVPNTYAKEYERIAHMLRIVTTADRVTRCCALSLRPKGRARFQIYWPYLSVIFNAIRIEENKGVSWSVVHINNIYGMCRYVDDHFVQKME